MSPAADPAYEERVLAEAKHFQGRFGFGPLPPAHHYWSNKYLRPEVERIYGIAGLVEMYAQECTRAFTVTGSRRILSIGCGRGDVEVDIACRLRAAGEEGFQIDCLELVPDLCEQGRRHAAARGVGDQVSFLAADMNTWSPDQPGKYAAVIANQILHHVVELEHLVQSIRSGLSPQGLLVTRDMIGRNGHRCWPEVKEVIDELWSILPRRLTYDVRFERFYDTYPNRNLAADGFEGIRSQDILPLLVENFHFERFIAFGGLIERVAGRAFGHNWRVEEDEGDRALLELVYLLNFRLIQAGSIKPTQVIATLSVEPSETVCGFGWTPEFCVRPPDA